MRPLRLFKMSAFSRGWCSSRPAFKRSKTTIQNAFFARAQQPRHFSSTSRFSAASVASKGAKTKLKETNASRLRPSGPKQNVEPTTPATLPHVYRSYAASIAEKSHPVLLYQAPSHTLFTIFSYSGAVFCLGYAGYNFESHCLNAPPDLDQWVPIAFGGICFLMAALGGWLLLGPARIVKSITAVPQKSLRPNGQPSLKLEVELRKMFPVPFFPARKLLVSPEDVKLPYSLSGHDTLSAAELRASRLSEKRAEQEAREYDKNHILTLGLGRHIRSGASELFRAVRQSWTREGFGYISVKGQRYKFDVSRGWALDGGKALERLARVENRLPLT